MERPRWGAAIFCSTAEAIAITLHLPLKRARAGRGGNRCYCPYRAFQGAGPIESGGLQFVKRVQSFAEKVHRKRFERRYLNAVLANDLFDELFLLRAALPFLTCCRSGAVVFIESVPIGRYEAWAPLDLLVDALLEQRVKLLTLRRNLVQVL